MSKTNLQKVVGFFLNNWKVWANINFFLIVLINVTLLISLSDTSQIHHLSETAEIVLLWIFKSFQIIACLLTVITYFFQNSAILAVKYGSSDFGENQARTKLLPKAKGSSIDALIDKYEETQKEEKKCHFMYLFKQFNAIWNVLMLLISISGLFVIQYLFYPILLLDIIQRFPALGNVIKAVRANSRTLLYTLLLLMVILYLYSIFAFVFFSHDFLGDSSKGFKMYCSNLMECYISVLNGGLRTGGGLGESLDQDILGSSSFWARYFFDLSFFVIGIIIMLNIIFGVILDAFADLRDKDKARQEDIENRCLVCGLQKFQLQTEGQGWRRHIKQEHNIWSYVYFILMVQDKKREECTGLEKYVKEQIENNETQFFPSGEALVLKEKNRAQ